VAELTRLPSGYPALLEELKTRIRAAQLSAALTLNQETVRLYWSIGQDLSSRFAAEGWGTKVVDRLAKDLGNEFPGVEGFSLRNLRLVTDAVQGLLACAQHLVGFIASYRIPGRSLGPPVPLSTLQETPRDVPCKTRGQDGFATSFPVGLLHPLQHAGLSRRSPVCRPLGI
jgi:DUF1016 N-terminal domain